jgi:hypothetical protein
VIDRLLVGFVALLLAGFIVLVLIGSQADFPTDSTARIAGQTEPPRLRVVGLKQLGPAPVLRPGVKLVGAGVAGSTNQGISVALSGDGNTAILGGPGPNNADRDRLVVGPAGAAWVFTRSEGVWTQQGKLVGSTGEQGGGLWSQGASVALSADGNTVIVGGPSDNAATGAAWVFTRSNGVWMQQGDKLVGTGPSRVGEQAAPPGQGISVALSGDGNTAVVGGWRAEAAWVFTRHGGVWKQHARLAGAGVVGSARQGMSVALSADGNTAIVGGWADNSRAGAAWVFTRRGDAWKQQAKLVGAGAVGHASQGTSVALSADGNTAIVGGPTDSPWDRSVPFGLGPAGAAWVFTRTDGVWTQQGNKLVSTRDAGSARHGMSVALSGDGNTAIVGGVADDRGVGAASVFARRGGHWQQSKQLVGTGAMAASSVALSDDGSIVMVGASNDNGGIGAAWMFTESGSLVDQHSGRATAATR